MQTIRRLALVLVTGGLVSVLVGASYIKLPPLQSLLAAAPGIDLPQAAPRVAPGDSLQIGQPAPDFTLRTLGGEEITLSSLKEQAILINFWATWCPPCRLEMPELADTYRAHQAEGLVVLAVNLTYQDNREAIEAFVEEFDLPFPILLDETGTVVNDRFRVRGLPTSVFVDRNGIVTHVQIGIMTREQMEEYVAEALR